MDLISTENFPIGQEYISKRKVLEKFKNNYSICKLRELSVENEFKVIFNNIVFKVSGRNVSIESFTGNIYEEKRGRKKKEMDISSWFNFKGGENKKILSEN